MAEKSRWGPVVGLAACITVLLGAGVVGAITVDEEQPTGQGPPTPGAPAPGAGTVAVAPPIDLAGIVVGGPPGFEQIPDARLLVGGAADVDRLAAERADQARSKAVFVETGLVGGFVRAWQKPSTAELVTVRLYQFADAEGAKSYATKIIAAMSKAPATTFSLPATDNTIGINTQVAAGANRLVYVVGRKGRVVAAIAANVVPPPDTGFLAPLSRSQLSLLP